MIQEKVQVLWNKKVGSAYYKIGLRCHRNYSAAKPGQFIMLLISDQTPPLLRRPFSIHNLIFQEGHLKGIEILYKVMGKGTKKMSSLAKGDFVDLLGPLGNGFNVSDSLHDIFIVAGGIGVAPLFFLVLSLQNKNISLAGIKIFLGAKSSDDLLCNHEFTRLGFKTQITTEDGSAGDHCLITDPLKEAVKEKRPDIIYACGPVPMLKHVADIAEKYAVPCQISTETIMACGIGACLGCVVERKGSFDKYLHVCKDGPVFNANVIKI